MRAILVFIALFWVQLAASAQPAAAPDPFPPEIRAPTEAEALRLDASWRTIQFFDAGAYPDNTIKAIIEITPLVKSTYGPNHPIMLRLDTLQADSLARKGKYAEAEVMLAANVSAFERRIGADKGYTYAARVSRGANLIQMGRLADAAIQYEENHRLTVSQDTLPPLERASLGLDLAYLRRMQGRFAEAEALARAALEARLAMPKRNEIDIAVARASLARALTGLGRLADATAIVDEGLASHPKQDVGRVRLLFAAGEALSEAGRMIDAQKRYKEAADLAKTVEGFDAPTTLQATVRHRVAMVDILGASSAASTSQVTDGLPIVVGAGQCTTPIASLSDADRAMQSTSVAHMVEDRHVCLTKLRSFLETALGRDSPETLNVRELLAGTLDRMGDSEPALEEARTLLAARERINGEQHPATARAALLYGRALAALGRDFEAKAFFARASLVLPAQAHSLDARRLDSAGMHEEAATEWQRAVTAFDAGASQNLPLGIEIMSGRVFNALYQGRCASEIRKDLTTLVTSPLYPLLGKIKAPSDEANAILLACEGKWAEADTIYQRLSFESVSNAISFQDAELARLEARRALVFVKNPKMTQTTYFAMRNATFYARERRYTPDRDAKGKPLGLRRENATSGTDPLAIVFANAMAVAWTQTVQAGGGDRQHEGNNDAFTAAQDFAQGQAAASLLQSAARAAVADPELGSLIDRQEASARRIAIADRAAAIAGTTGDAAAKTQIDAERKQLADLTSELRRRFPGYANTARPFGLSISDLRKRMKPGEAVLMIQPVGQNVYSFAVSVNGFSWNKAKITRRDMDRLVSLVRCRIDAKSCTLTLTGDLLFDGEASASLYRELVAPVVAGFGDAQTLYTVTGGSLGSIPMGILVTGKAPAAAGDQLAQLANLAKTRWLADDYALATLPSVSSLRAYDAVKLRPNGPVFAGVGDPVLGPPAQTVRGGSTVKTANVRGANGLAEPGYLKTFTSLPGTRRELVAIARSLGSPEADLLLAEAARETNVKSSVGLSQARIVAFATHAMLPGELEGNAEPGLVLTPPASPTAQDDGYLTASEAAALKLNADWVLLSACNTAGPADGDSGESLSGLARAFFFAGARSVLVSHWPVEDSVGATITSETFRIAAARPDISRAESLRLALRGIRSGTSALGDAIPGWKAAWADPWAWAPFSLIESGS